MKNLDNNARLGKDLEESVNELQKILEKDEKPHKWQLHNLHKWHCSTNAILCNSFKAKEK